MSRRLGRSHLLRPAVVFPGLLIVLFLSAWRASDDFPGDGRFFPTVIAVVGIISGAVNLWHAWRAPDVRVGRIDAGDPAAPPNAMNPSTQYLRFARYTGWVVGYYVVTLAMGAPIAMAAFLFAFLRWEARASWWAAALISGAVAMFLAVYLVAWLGLSVPPGWLSGTLSGMRLLGGR